MVITPKQDADYEGPETAILTVAASSGYTLSNPSGTVIIADDDLPQVAVYVDSTTASEEDATKIGKLHLARLNDSKIKAALTINIKIGGTATKDADYTLGGVTGTTVTIPANADVSGPITVTAIDDNILDNGETVELEAIASSDATYALGSPLKGVITITDTDAVPVVTINAHGFRRRSKTVPTMANLRSRVTRPPLLSSR